LNSILSKSEKYLYPFFAVGLLVFAYQYHEWSGVIFVVSGGVMWALLHLSRVLQVFKKAANRPIGYVDSAVMVNAKLKKGLTLLHVIALTKSLGEKRAEDQSADLLKSGKEVFYWQDSSESYLKCEFLDGKLKHYELIRPAVDS